MVSKAIKPARTSHPGAEMISCSSRGRKKMVNLSLVQIGCQLNIRIRKNDLIR